MVTGRVGQSCASAGVIDTASAAAAKFILLVGMATPIRQSDAMGNQLTRSSHSGLRLAARTTLPHFSVSSAMSWPNAAGEPASASPPMSANRAFILGSASAALISWLSLSMISGGVLLGAPTPYHWLAS